MGPGSVLYTWWDCLSATFCGSRIQDTASTQAWGSCLLAPLPHPCPGLRKDPGLGGGVGGHRVLEASRQHWAMEATLGPLPDGLVWVEGENNPSVLRGVRNSEKPGTCDLLFTYLGKRGLGSLRITSGAPGHLSSTLPLIAPRRPWKSKREDTNTLGPRRRWEAQCRSTLICASTGAPRWLTYRPATGRDRTPAHRALVLI